MKLFSFFSFMVVTLLPLQTLHAAPTKIDGISAIVDSKPILESDIQNRFQIVKDRVPGGVMTDNIHRQIQNQMIDEALQVNYARKIGMRVSSTDVDNAILGVAQNMNLDLQGLKNVLASKGINYSRYREQIEQEILINNVKRETLKKRIVISEQEINDYLSSDTSITKEKEQVRLRHLLIRASNPEEAEAKIRSIRQKINTEEDFIQQAVENSDGQFAIEGGDLGWRPLNQLPPLFVRALETDQGPLIGPLQSNAGFHLLWLIEKRSPDVTLQQQTKVRHILVRANEIRNIEQTKVLAEELYNKLENGADFAQLAKEQSEDQGSTLQGGDLGWVTPGTMVPEFESMMDQTSIGSISKPFRTQFGWHILQVEGRREADISDKVKRSNAERALTAQKQDVVLGNWLDELRADAFIDIKK
ncbi:MULTISPECIES: peptidylprolyl isomerase [Marinomonas]|uniref:Chaperone SurA n=1 Tax=Marinomonas arctica TaxID=383750 RepID=A0A7H1J3S7_9GAMM|nr:MULTISPECIES: peptidylprolyl isomerase [Marinomonas]MCS7486981.1 peptidylprolyl isomerase [Marinomonas sp. BSi20414]QNT05143.1 peptidylprolyl isomerase [Marinomonas arctica]GGN15823.1 chaperone SurA [Marinomonas arctica]